jgi:hypothetical protein
LEQETDTALNEMVRKKIGVDLQTYRMMLGQEWR